MKHEENELSNLDVIPAEADDDYSDDSLYNINSWGADLSFREIVDRYDEGDIVKPEMQRNYVWEKAEASRFIDSILLGLPVPSVFFAKPDQNAEKMLIVDGYQRIMTVYDFMAGKFRGDNKIFRLTKSQKVNKRWRGKAFLELHDNEQKKIKNTTIHAIIFVQVKPMDDTSFFQIFERINTSGRTLLPQEIRNCVYQGAFNSLLIELNGYSKWRELFGLTKADPRMRDMEFILRYFAVSATVWDKNDDGAISLKKYLSTFMGGKESTQKAVLDRRKSEFTSVIDIIHETYGDTAFQNISEKTSDFTGKFNPTIFDSLMTATKIAQHAKVKFDKKTLRDKRIKLLEDPKFQNLIRIRTTNKSRIAGRISAVLRKLYSLQYV